LFLSFSFELFEDLIVELLLIFAFVLAFPRLFAFVILETETICDNPEVLVPSVVVDRADSGPNSKKNE